MIKALFRPGNLFALAAGAAGYFAVESYFKRHLLPYPSMPFQVAGAMASFCAVEALEAFWSLLLSFRSSRQKRRGLKGRIAAGRMVGAA